MSLKKMAKDVMRSLSPRRGRWDRILQKEKWQIPEFKGSEEEGKHLILYSAILCDCAV
jgi:hypothetical protein